MLIEQQKEYVVKVDNDCFENWEEVNVYENDEMEM